MCSGNNEQFLSAAALPYRTQNGGCLSKFADSQPSILKRPKSPAHKTVKVVESNKNQFDVEFLEALHKLTEITERNEVRLSEKDRMNAMTLEWKMCALVLDRFFLTSFVIVMAVMSYLIILRN